MKELENGATASAQCVKQLADSAETTAALAGWEKVIAGDGAADWMNLRPLSATAGDGVTLTVQDDLSIFATGPRPDKTNYTIELPGTVANLTGLRIESIPDDRLPSKGAGRSDSGNAVLTRLRASVGGKEIAFSAASADYTQQGFSPAGAIDDKPETAWAIYPDTMHPHALVVQTATLVQNAEGAPLTLTFEFQSANTQHQLGRFRIAATTVVDPVGRATLPADIAAILKREPASRAKEDAAKLRAHFLKTNPPAELLPAQKK